VHTVCSCAWWAVAGEGGRRDGMVSEGKEVGKWASTRVHIDMMVCMHACAHVLMGVTEQEEGKGEGR